MATWTWFDGKWHEGSPRVIAPADHAMWMSSVVFDGARRFEGVAPDLDAHCARVINSAKVMGLEPKLAAKDIEALAREGFSRFPGEAALYIKPMFWASEGFIAPDPASTQFALMLIETPMPAFKGFSAMLSGFRRPGREMAPTSAKAACLYPNSARAIAEAQRAGFDNCVMLDGCGNVAEFATANIFIASGGVLHTPAPNGTFLNGITKQRVMALLRAAGVEIIERGLTWEEVMAADEIFATGNFAKVMPCIRIGERQLPIGPLARQARALYMDFAHGRAQTP